MTNADADRISVEQLIERAWSLPVGSDGWVYAQRIRTALHYIDAEIVYALVAEGERTGRQLELTYDAPIETQLTTPSGVRLSDT